MVFSKLRKRLLFISTLVALLAIALVGMIVVQGNFVVPEVALAEEVEPIASEDLFEMQTGATVKTKDEDGIRFKVKMGANVYNKIVSNDAVTLNFAFVPENNYLIVENNYIKAGRFDSLPTQFYLNLEINENTIYTDGEFFYANGGVKNIKEANRSLNYVCRAYVKTGNDGAIYDFATIENDDYNNVSRSLYTILSRSVALTEEDLTKRILGNDLFDWFGTEETPICADTQSEYNGLISNIINGYRNKNFQNKYVYVLKDDVAERNTNAEQVAKENENVTFNNAVKVTFNPANNKKPVTFTRVKVGSSVSKPSTTYTKTGYTFDYWKTAKDMQFDFASPLNNNVNLTARYEPNKYKVTYKSNGSTYKKTVTYDAEYGAGPSILEREHSQTFSGWYVGDVKVEETDIVKVLNDDLVLEARFTDNVNYAPRFTDDVTYAPRKIYLEENLGSNEHFNSYTVSVDNSENSEDPKVPQDEDPTVPQDGGATVTQDEGTTVPQDKGATVTQDEGGMKVTATNLVKIYKTFETIDFADYGYFFLNVKSLNDKSQYDGGVQVEFLKYGTESNAEHYLYSAAAATFSVRESDGSTTLYWALSNPTKVADKTKVDKWINEQTDIKFTISLMFFDNGIEKSYVFNDIGFVNTFNNYPNYTTKLPTLEYLENDIGNYLKNDIGSEENYTKFTVTGTIPYENGGGIDVAFKSDTKITKNYTTINLYGKEYFFLTLKGIGAWSDYDAGIQVEFVKHAGEKDAERILFVGGQEAYDIKNADGSITMVWKITKPIIINSNIETEWKGEQTDIAFAVSLLFADETRSKRYVVYDYGYATFEDKVKIEDRFYGNVFNGVYEQKDNIEYVCEGNNLILSMPENSQRWAQLNRIYTNFDASYKYFTLKVNKAIGALGQLNVKFYTLDKDGIAIEDGNGKTIEFIKTYNDQDIEGVHSILYSEIFTALGDNVENLKIVFQIVGTKSQTEAYGIEIDYYTSDNGVDFFSDDFSELNYVARGEQFISTMIQDNNLVLSGKTEESANGYVHSKRLRNVDISKAKYVEINILDIENSTLEMIVRVDSDDYVIETTTTAGIIRFCLADFMDEINVNPYDCNVYLVFNVKSTQASEGISNVDFGATIDYVRVSETINVA